MVMNDRSLKEKFRDLPAGKKLGVIVGAMVLIVALIWSVDWLIYRLTHATTNDAFVEGDLVSLSPLVPGHVAELYVDEFQPFKKDEVLAMLDDRDYRAARDKARANYENAKINYERYSNLYATRSVAKKVYDEYEANYLEAEGALEEAELNVEYCKIAAPFDGVIAKRFVKPGDFAGPGLPVFSAYDPRTIYVLANMGEAKLHGVHEGNEADIWVDASHGRKLKGKVWQIGTAAAAKFALIPRDVTAGEFTKVEQRLPIKISVPNAWDYWFLRPGLAAEVGIERTKE
jgi:multidrug resistance efflux pump